MTIIIPAYITDPKNIDLILDQLYVTIESYYFHKNTGKFLIFTNSYLVINAFQKFNSVFGRDVKVERIDFDKEWKSTGLPINDVRTRKNFIISKLIIPFVYDGDYILMDWDMLITGYIDPTILISDKMRFFNPKYYDGLNLRQNSIRKGLVPENESVGKTRWVNSGLAYFPKDIQKSSIIEYWEKFDSIKTQEYRGIFLFDIIGDELIYNLMLIDGSSNIEECTKYNINSVLKNLYYSFDRTHSMYSFGKNHPHILSVHFAVGHAKPFNVILNEKGDLSYTVTMERYNMEGDDVRWTFDATYHRIGSLHYNALMFSIIWQHTRYSIREKLGLEEMIISSRYSEFFDRCFVNYER